MTLALRSPQLIDNIISVDNAPLDAALLNDFAKYIQGMRRIEEAMVTRQAEADKILQNYEEASQGQMLSTSLTDMLVTVRHNPPIPPG
jgi:hypothetical protein